MAYFSQNNLAKPSPKQLWGREDIIKTKKTLEVFGISKESKEVRSCLYQTLFRVLLNSLLYGFQHLGKNLFVIFSEAGEDFAVQTDAFLF